MKIASKLAVFVAAMTITHQTAAAENITVVSRISGVIESVEAREGDVVRAGAALARLDDDLARVGARKAEALVRAAAARALETKRNLERQRIMAKRGLIPPSELEEAETAAAAAAGEEELARAWLEEAKLNLEYTVIKAPVSGRIVRVMAHPGQVIRLDVELTPLFEIKPAR